MQKRTGPALLRIDGISKPSTVIRNIISFSRAINGYNTQLIKF